MAQANLIYDIGMHVGKDTRFYLNKGFKVIAVEANPLLVERGMNEFRDWIDQGSLTIVPKAICTSDEDVTFYVNLDKDDWSSTDPEVGARRGSAHKSVTVAATTMQELFSRFGVPYYAKIDIEGADSICLAQILEFGERPTYLSVEAEIEDQVGLDRQIELLGELGYTKFQVVNQLRHQHTKPPLPPREGEYFEMTFDGHCSGLFGRELSRRWINLRRLRKVMRGLLTSNMRHGAQGLVLNRQDENGFLRGLHERVYHSIRRRIGRPLGWYDIHARA